MQLQHVGSRIRVFYNVASYALKIEAIMSTTAHQKPDASVFWDKHGLEAAQDTFGVSRSTFVLFRRILWTITKIYRLKI